MRTCLFKRSHILRILLCSLTLLVGISCNTKLNDHSDHEVFRYNESAKINSLDPAFARNQANLWAVNQLFNGLVQMNQNLEIIPCIARQWEISDSGRVYTFKLRDDVSFHKDQCFGEDGSRLVNAHDFVYSFSRLTSKSLAAPGSWIFQYLEEASALNDSTLALKLTQSFPPFLSLLTMKYASVVPKEAIDFYGSEFRQHPVGTGPFYFKLWVENEKLVLRKNTQYFEKDSLGNNLPYLEAVAISFVPDKQSSFLEFIKGNIDLISGIDASYKDELLSYDGQLQEKYQERFSVYRQAYLNTEYLAFLVDTQLVDPTSPLADVKVRQAINYGFDRVKMMKFLRNNIGTPALAGMIPSGLPSSGSQQIGYHYDPKKSRALLAEAGYPNGQGLAEITLQTNASYLDLCEYIQGELIKVGINLKVEVTPPSSLRQAIATSKVPFFRASWIADYPDGENYLSLFYSKNHSPDGPNYSHFSDTQFDRLYQMASVEQDEERRIDLYKQMDSIVMAAAPVVPLFYDQVLRFYPKGISGLEGNAMNMLDLKYVRKPIN